MLEIASNYGLTEDNLYFFFHYHPSFYHLHIHCAIISNDAISNKHFRCKMLDNVIYNLQKDGNYYIKNSIDFEIPDYHIIVKLLNK